MNRNFSDSTSTNTSTAEPACPLPWCIVNHADPHFDSDCHVADADWSSALGLSLSSTDGAPTTVDVMWDHAGEHEMLKWTPEQAREAAAELLRLADEAEKNAAATR